ncbi:hypothetical protein E2C01_034021 [Portunus trituberculatus]|uniref:Uncharacterized protein n=1 Tax=Portunus trituberculatus TaxID=210409 RepID=A0A5B7F7D5_PORTR|nr:hypothetical protein [Portunus trituberculatus]
MVVVIAAEYLPITTTMETQTGRAVGQSDKRWSEEAERKGVCEARRLYSRVRSQEGGETVKQGDKEAGR